MENFKQVAQANSFTVYEEGQDEEFFLYGDFSGVTIEEAAVAAWDQSLLEISFVKCDSPQGAEKIYDNALDSLMSYASDEEYRQISEEGYQITYTLETDDEGNYINLLDEGVLLVDDCIFMISNYTLSDEEQDIQSMPSIEAFFNDLKIPLQLSE